MLFEFNDGICVVDQAIWRSVLLFLLHFNVFLRSGKSFNAIPSYCLTLMMLPPENIRKPPCFLYFGWIEMEHCSEIGWLQSMRFKSSPPGVFLGKYVLKICSKFTGKHPCWSVISIKLFCNFIEIAFRHWCAPVTLLHISRTYF